jgi:hypothetical protein
MRRAKAPARLIAEVASGRGPAPILPRRRIGSRRLGTASSVRAPEPLRAKAVAVGSRRLPEGRERPAR